MSDDFNELPETFDPSSQEGTNEPLPVGTYVAQVIHASVAQPRTGDGNYIALTWEITEGDYENRRVWQNITFQHSSETARRIGRQNLKDLCVAVGFNEPLTSLEPVKFVPCRLKVGIEQDKQGIYPDRNRVSRVYPLQPPPRSGPITTGPINPSTGNGDGGSTPPQATAKSATPAWRKDSVAGDLQDEVPF